MLNRVVLVGRLTRDPDLRYTPNGAAVANFTLAVNRPFSNQQGNRDADFINCVVWRRQAENLAQYMSKGSMVGVDGRVQTRTFETKEGRTAFVTEIVADSVQFLESKGSSQNRSQPSTGYQPNPSQNQNQSQSQNQNQPDQNNNNPFKDNGEPIDISDDDLPF
ncbi:single-stranded DNA-binding protein [Lentibacillus salicampi]|uniref:Single-stranded DNA-binding protein n=1 Tax=Lentibacillus salicampi TaxID=175306 RepID=A0A4Y9AAQ3_9BACI|nr:single-stranded DNA-binding protein [Lentibacillus salicampi]TFJ92277.1 single-stranded DNA-binding protein [Lentibacillus salicampi]